MTARVRRPLVASISLVLPFALSISRLTGSESSATIATTCAATTTLPWPTFIRCTAAPLRLLKILHLLPHLLQHALAGQRRLAQLEVVGLAGDRVDLAAELLQQEVERPPHRAALVEHERQLGEVRAQARQLLGDVRLVGPDGRLGDDPTLVHAGGAEERAQPLAQPLLAPGRRGRRPPRHGHDDGAELGVQAAQLLREPPALGGPPLDQLVQRTRQRRLQQAPRHLGLGRLRLLHAYHPGTAEHPLEWDR